jgi:hypothetical protein
MAVAFCMKLAGISSNEFGADAESIVGKME